MTSEQFRPETRAIRSGRSRAPGVPLNAPIVPASNFHHGGDREYSRGDNTESIDAFEAAVGDLEGGWGVAFSSGMAAISAILDQLPPGARIAAPKDCYQGVAMILDDRVVSHRWEVERIETADTNSWLSVIEAKPDLVWIESPSNPMLTVGDVPAICTAAEAAGVACAVDNTFATPLLQRPLDHGAAYSVHSATKFIGGHSDLLGGIVVTADPARRDALNRRRTLGGAVIGSLEAFLALRGLRTMPVRLARSQASAADLALRLNDHAAVSQVHYPGLSTDPGYATAKRSLAGPGAVLSFQTAGSGEDLDKALQDLQVVAVATSLGGVESTIERRARLTGQEHIPQTLVRLSVGCEHVEDLWQDLSGMLSKLEGFAGS